MLHAVAGMANYYMGPRKGSHCGGKTVMPEEASRTGQFCRHAVLRWRCRSYGMCIRGETR